jgi:ADP-ribose pyrophosphatase
MALRRWTRLAQETLFRNPWWEYRRDALRLPSGADGEYHYVHTPGSVMLLPRNDDGSFILVRQYRYLLDRESVEFPAGGVKETQSVGDAAIAELREEAAVEADMLREIGRFNPFNGVTDELCHVFLATGLRACEAMPDATEEFEILTCSENAIQQMIIDGHIWDGMSLAAWALFCSVSGKDAEE